MNQFFTSMDIQLKINELKEKQADCEKRISEIKEIKTNLGRQIRKLQGILEDANELFEESPKKTAEEQAVG